MLGIWFGERLRLFLHRKSSWEAHAHDLHTKEGICYLGVKVASTEHLHWAHQPWELNPGAAIPRPQGQVMQQGCICAALHCLCLASRAYLHSAETQIFSAGFSLSSQCLKCKENHAVPWMSLQPKTEVLHGSHGICKAAEALGTV